MVLFINLVKVLKNDKSPLINDNNEIVGLITTNKKSAEKAIKKLGLNINLYDDYKSMLDSVSFDAIYIATPPKYHYEYLKKVNIYNKIVLVEKPFVLNYKEALDIYNLYKKNVYPLLYKGSTEKIKTIKDIIESNKYEEPIKIIGNFKRPFKAEYLDSWIYNSEISGGGRVFDIIEHILEVLYYIFGDFKNVKSNVIKDSKYHNCETKVNANLYCGNIPTYLNFDMECDEYVDEITIYTNEYEIKFSVNNHDFIHIIKNGKIIKEINKPTNRIWGTELITKINKIINNEKVSYIPDLEVILKIQKCVDEIIN